MQDLVYIKKQTGELVRDELPWPDGLPLDLDALKAVLFPGRNKFEIANLDKLDRQFMDCFTLLQGAGVSCRDVKGNTLLAVGIDKLIQQREGLHADTNRLRDDLQKKTDQVIEYMQALAKERGRIQDLQSDRDRMSFELEEAKAKIKKLEAKLGRVSNSERVARQKLGSAQRKLEAKK